MTLLVASDLHLDAQAGLSRLVDQESSWVRFCTAAAELGAAVLWGGDSHHHRKPSPAAIAAWQSGLAILREGGCDLYGIPGNHCVTSEDLPSTLEVASAGYDCTIFRAPDARRLEDGIVAFLPWAPPRLSAAEASEALMVLAAEQAERGARILIAHHAIAGGSLPTGLPLLDLAEPMLDPHALAAMGYEFVLPGHIHKRQVIIDDGACLVAHIGVLARTSFGEASVPTGGWQIAGGIPTHFDVPDRAFVTIDADVRGSIDATEQLLAAIDQHEIEGAIVRVAWSQTSDQVVDTVAVLTQLQGQGAHRVDAITPVIERAQSVRSAGISETSDPREAWDAWQSAQGDTASDDVLEAVREEAHRLIGGAL